MPFYLNFVEDRTLSEISGLKHFRKTKAPRFKIKSRKIPKEKDIRGRYTFSLPANINSMENRNSSMHILEKPWPLIRKIEEMLKNCKKASQESKSEKNTLREDMVDFSKKHMNSLNEIQDHLH